jgi:phosphoglycerate kinase
MGRMLSAIPPLDSLSELPSGTPVLLRGDLDVQVLDEEVVEDVRLRSALPTIRFGLERGWRWIVMGHIGRRPDLTLAPVARRLQELCGAPVHFVPDWFDESTDSITPRAQAAIANQPHGALILLENTRQYAVERALWGVSPEDFDPTAARLLSVATAMRDGFAQHFVNDGLAASNLDFSSCVLPLVMDSAVLGSYTRGELSLALEQLDAVDCVIFSGVKANKLDDLEDIVSTRSLHVVIVAGALAMALCKAREELGGRTFCYGIPEQDSTDVAHMSDERVAQGRRILERCATREIDVELPIDYRVDNGEIVTTIPSDRRQLDIGPATIERFTASLSKRAADGSLRTGYLNGSAGVFEDPEFSHGTRAIIEAFCALTPKGIRTFVGGGDARVALLQFATEDSVTHAFTAGGTILKVMKSSPIGYVASSYYRACGAAHE